MTRIIMLFLCLIGAVAPSTMRLSAEVDTTNTWFRVATQNTTRGYEYASPIYVPPRKQILHWGAVRNIYRVPLWNRNDVMAFDADRGDWFSDYPSTPDLKPSHSIGQTGIGTSIRGTAGMLPDGRPTPSMVVNAVCYDSRRMQVVYAMKGLMAAYDPVGKTWSDMQAFSIVDGRTYPGGPPVYGAGMAYDPLNDEIVMFPHWSGSGDPKNTDRLEATGEISGHLGTMIFTFTDRTWRRARMQVQPPPRCAAPMVLHPAKQVLVLFGGRDGIVRADLKPGFHLGARPGALNDTWLYDPKTRVWKELDIAERPPPPGLPNLFYDPTAGLVFLVTFTEQSRNRKKAPATCTFWTLDLEETAWERRLHIELPFELTYEHKYASTTPLFNLGYDPDRRLLVLAQNKRDGTEVTQETWTMQLDLTFQPAEPAPAWTPLPPPAPVVWPAPDPEHAKRLVSLPRNEWVDLEPKGDHEVRRDWGNVAFDPVENRFYYYGGGHATYQVNDVAIYDVAANTWIRTVGEHNDLIPPIGWGGIAMGFRGGHHAHHQRNEYQAVAGRMYVSVGGTKGYIGWGSADKEPGMSWYFEPQSNAVWRMKKVTLDLGPGVDKPYGEPHMSDAEWRIHSLALNPEHRYAKKLASAFYCVLDAHTDTLSVRAVPEPWPSKVGEMRSFCLAGDRNEIYYYDYTPKKGNWPGTHRLWKYSIRENRFSRIASPRLPPAGRMPTLEYIRGQGVLFAVVQPEGRSKREQEQWVYRLDQNTWEPLPFKGERPVLQTPYGQMAYVPDFGVLINVAKKTVAMRIDVR